MPETFKILDGFDEIGISEGFRHSDERSAFILFPPDFYQIIQPGNTLVDSSNNYLQLDFEDPIVENSELKAFKMYYH